MRLATIRLGDQTAAVRVEGTTAIETGFADVGALLRAGGLEAAATADGARHDVDTVDLAPVCRTPARSSASGNYRNHILRCNYELPEHPTLPPAPGGVDRPAGRDPTAAGVRPGGLRVNWPSSSASGSAAPAEEAKAAIAGYSVLNDVMHRVITSTARCSGQGQYRRTPRRSGRCWSPRTRSRPTRSWSPSTVRRCSAPHRRPGFDAAALVRYIPRSSRCNRATSSPPAPRWWHAQACCYLAPGQKLTTSVDGIGELVNVAVQEKTAQRVSPPRTRAGGAGNGKDPAPATTHQRPGQGATWRDGNGVTSPACWHSSTRIDRPACCRLSRRHVIAHALPRTPGR